MAATIDQKEYLKKYLSGNKSDEKKKKKKKRLKAGAGVKIIDDDMDVSKMRSVDDAEIEMMFEGDDAPQIAGIIDDRPEALKNTDDVGRGTKWRVIGQDDGSNFNFSVQELSHKIKKTKKSSPYVSDLGQSPPQLNTTIKKHKPTSDDSNANSVIRKDAKHNRVDSNQNHRHEKRPHDSSSPTRKPDKTSTHSDKSPPRKKMTNSKPNVQPSVDRRKESDSDLSPPRNDKQNSDSDLSPPRNAGNNSDLSPPRKRERYTRNSVVDSSPPRRKKLDKFKSCAGDLSPPRRHQKADSGNHYESNSRGSNSHSRNRRRDSDQSPPRQKSRSDRKGSTNRDLSPQRRSNKDGDGRKRSRWGPEEERSAPSAEQNTRAGDKMKTTLDGKTAGLQDAKNLVAESRTIRRREDEMFAQMSEDVSGRNAKAVVRNRGRKETSAEREAQRQKEEQQKERDAKYARWGKGLKQTEAQEANVRDYLHEASKPLARYKSDVDLDDQLRQQDREGDPMLEYLRSKGKNVRPDDTDVKPIYKGAYPPNRFNIRPGYRWDGVDRSNGYENKFFESKNKKIAQESDAYKWSTEDM